jgi:hypothetical protein
MIWMRTKGLDARTYFLYNTERLLYLDLTGQPDLAVYL